VGPLLEIVEKVIADLAAAALVQTKLAE